MSIVNTQLAGKLAIISISSPPVNALNAQMRQELLEALEKLQQVSEVEAILLHCEGRTFICGADIREFDGDPIAPHLPDVTQALERSNKPVVAVLHGHVLGGGLEVAAACHYRIAKRGTNVGLPEVTLGVVPGAGGCQRAMRLIGIAKAIALATSGRAQKVESEALEGLCDALIEPAQLQEASLLECAQHWVEHKLAAEDLMPRPTAQLVFPAQEIDWEAVKKPLAKRAKANPTPLLLAEQLERDYMLSVEQGEQQTRALFLSLRQSDCAKALRHAFFLERKLASSSKAALKIDRVAVIGAGTMGSGIAVCLADAGLDVVLLEQSEQALQAGLERISENYAKQCKQGRISQDQADARTALIKGSCDYADIAEVDLVIEAAFESLSVKEAIFRRLDEVCKAGAILATNTSYLDIDKIAAVTKRPQAVLGLHFFSPANVMKLLEIVQAASSSEEAIEQMQLLAVKLRKQAVTVGVCFGFAANRIYTRYGREIQQMLLEGASVQQVDAAMRDFGMAMGPLAVQDLSGIDIGHNARSQYPQPAEDPGYFKVSAALVTAGRLGRKTGAGFYRYEDGAAHSDGKVDDIIAQTARALNIPSQFFSAQDIQQRALLAMISEAVAVLEEGIAECPEAVDLIWLHGYGFPRAKGGPMFWAQLQGEQVLQQALEELQQRYGSAIWPSIDLAKWL
ncbi:MAG: 3-hydroxyacyl-CoA dehydrogenase NAD-binding domain-containing protein [Pseudomonadales bacterium]